jgi:hypothetical protein
MIKKAETLGRMPVIVVVLLMVITAGLYIPIWFIRATSTLARLKTTTKLTRWLPYGFLALSLLGLAIGIDSDVVRPGRVGGLDSELLFLVWALYAGSHIYLAFTVVEILYGYSGDTIISNVPMAQARTILASIIYLQYLVNRIPAPVTTMQSPTDERLPNG